MRGDLRAYLHLGVFSLLMALVLRLGIEYLKNRQISFDADDPLFLALCAGFFLLSFLARSLAMRSVRCSVCGTVSHDVLIFGNGESKRFCRAHMIERFRREFTACGEKMVVFHPGLETKRGPYRYEYRAVADMSAKFLQSGTGRLIEQSLAAIGDRRCKCGRAASVAYFGPGSVPWESPHPDGAGMEGLRGLEFARRFLPACPFCIVDEVSLSLARFQGSFSEGVVLPYDGAGAFVSRLS